MPSLAAMRMRWNRAKGAECADAETGEAWWPQVSKEAFADGIKGAVEAYWNWQRSRAGSRAGKRAGFPRFAKKGRDRDRVTFTTGAIRLEPEPPPRDPAQDRDRPGAREHPAARAARGERAGADPRGHGVAEGHQAGGGVPGPGPAPPAAGRGPPGLEGRGRRGGAGARHRREQRRPGDRAGAEPAPAGGRAEGIAAPVPRAVPARPGLAPLRPDQPEDLPAAAPGRRHPRLPHPPPDRQARQDPRRDRGRRAGRGRDAAAEGPDGGPRQTARPVGLRPRRDPPPARLQERLVRLPARDRRPVLPLVEDLPRVRARPGHRVGRALDLRTRCGTAHQRDDNAAVNLARYEPPCAGDSAVGPVRAAVKRRADRETGPRPAGGDEARKGRGRTAAEQPRDGVPA